MVPHLTTALHGPLLDLEQRILDSSSAIERWFRLRWQAHESPFYTSVDLRNSGFKLAPVDTNLYPGGFNNLNPAFIPLAVQAATSLIERICPKAKNLLLIPENHTRNRWYLENVAVLAAILGQTGLEVRLGSLNPEVTGPTELETASGKKLTVEPLKRSGTRLGLEGFDPCAIVVNNDLSSGIPEILTGLDEQVLLPPLHAGWVVRTKSQHFAAYDDVASDFGQLLKIDPWLVNPYHAQCGEIDFQARAGEECLSSNVSMLLEKIRLKYLEYGIKKTPYVAVKADAGTYGMGVMMVRDASEVRDLNRKQRNKMAVVKEGLVVSNVIIQEGVQTMERIEDKVAEPVVYMIGQYVIGGFYRVHGARGAEENLNAPGMHFVPLAFDESCTVPDPHASCEAPPNRFYAYGVVGRLAAAGAALELERTAPPA
ncbi:MAG: glutamate--cysteine ligase [Proteobacteria bacterium]|nr:glutamate--cysteine ligase [Pseudomonadota bacterium]MDA0981871.1 glutamate--cysteine ligase [Pseudomonadota bacterium]